MTDPVETTRCSNCKKDILSSNYVIHNVHCQRNIFICSKCNEPVNQFQKTEHEANHALVFCTSCHAQVEKYKLNDHLMSDCPHRKIKCQICDIEIGACDLPEHENYCGARTEKCPECGEFVMFKYKQLHLDSNHTFIKLSDEPGPSPSWQNGRRTLGNFFPDLDLVNHTSQPSQSRQRKKSGRYDSSRHRVKLSPEFVDRDEVAFKDPPGKSGKQKSSSYQKNADRSCSSTAQDFKRRIAGEGVDSKSSSRSSRGSSFDEAGNHNHNHIDNRSEKGVNVDKTESSKKGKEGWSNREGCLPRKEQGKSEGKQTKGSSRDASTDVSVALAIRLSKELNGDFYSQFDDDDDKITAQTIEENTAVLSQFSLFDSLEKRKSTSGKNVFKNVCSSLKSSNASTRQHLTSYADDSDDDELLLYSKKAGGNDVDDAILPCQFCGALFPSYALMSHQEQCDSFEDTVDATRSDVYREERSPGGADKEGLIPCGICSRLIPFSRYSSHMALIHSGASKK